MRGIRTKATHKWKRPLFSVFLVLLLGVLISSVGRVYQKKENAEEALSRMQEENRQLTNRGQVLEETLSRLSSAEGIEFEIRKKLNVAKVGESVAVIVSEEEPPSVSAPNLSIWSQIKNFFADLFK